MTSTGLRVLERKSQPLRGAARVAPVLKADMERHGVSAKELAVAMRGWAAQDPANRWAPDYRTIQHAMLGTACALDTYLALAGFFGWDFTENVQTSIHGADPITARERELEQRLSQAAALHDRIERDRALRTASAPRLALVARETVVRGASAGSRGRAFDPASPEARP